MMVRSVVVLPAPFRPTRHTTSRSRTSSETRRRMWLAWMNTSISWTASIWDLPPHPALSPTWGRGFRIPSPLWGAGRVRGARRMRGASPAHDHVNDLGVSLYLRRCGVGQHPALVQRDDAIRVAEDDVHVVLDLDDGTQAHTLGRAHQDLHDRVLVRGTHAARRLVEQDDLGAQREGRGDVEELLVALGQRAREHVGLVGEAEERSDLQGVPLNLMVAHERGEEPGASPE